MNSIKQTTTFTCWARHIIKKKKIGDVDIETLIAAFPSFYRQYVIENPNSSL